MWDLDFLEKANWEWDYITEIFFGYIEKMSDDEVSQFFMNAFQDVPDHLMGIYITHIKYPEHLDYSRPEIVEIIYLIEFIVFMQINFNLKIDLKENYNVWRKQYTRSTEILRGTVNKLFTSDFSYDFRKSNRNYVFMAHLVYELSFHRLSPEAQQYLKILERESEDFGL